MPENWIVPTILMGLAAFLLLVWIPVIREQRRKK